MIHLTTAAFFFLYKAFVKKEIELFVINNPGKSFGKLKFLFYALSAIPVLYYWLPKVKASQLRNLIHVFFGSVIIACTVAIYQAIISGGGRSEGLIGIMRYGYMSAMILSLIPG